MTKINLGEYEIILDRGLEIYRYTLAGKKIKRELVAKFKRNRKIDKIKKQFF